MKSAYLFVNIVPLGKPTVPCGDRSPSDEWNDHFLQGIPLDFSTTEPCSPEAWNHDGFRKIIPFYGPTIQVSEIWSGWWLGTFRDNPSHWLSYFSRWFKPPTSYNLPRTLLNPPPSPTVTRLPGSWRRRKPLRWASGGLGRGPSVWGDFLWSPFGKLTKRTGKSPSFSSVHQLFLWVICSYVSLL